MWRSPNVEYGRVIGRIAECAKDGLEDCTGYLVVLWLHCGLGCASLHWVDPADVTDCHAPAPKLFDLLLTADLNDTKTAEIMIKAAFDGALSEHYIDKIPPVKRS